MQEMKNLTDCVIVLRSYEVASQRIRFKEFLFRDMTCCRRYCVCFEHKKVPYLYEITEHPVGFFDQVVEISSGKKLFDLYVSHHLDPVPLPHQKRQVFIQEFCVIYNTLYNEYSLIQTIEHGKPEVMTYHSQPIIVPYPTFQEEEEYPEINPWYSD